MKKQSKDWEKEFEERFAGKIDWLPVSGIIPEGISPRFVRHAQGELIEVIKDFIRQLLAQKEKEVKIKLLRRIIRNLETRKEWSPFNKYFLRDNVLEYLNQVMKEILEQK